MADHRSHKQGRGAIFCAGCCLVFLLVGFALAACGKKPGTVDPPPEVTNDTFPQVYPNPATDPKP